MNRATAGEVIYDGKDITKMTEKELAVLRYRELDFVFQAMHLVGNLSLRENICAAGYLNKKVKGSGLGLFTVKYPVEKQKGRIEIENVNPGLNVKIYFGCVCEADAE